MNILTNWVFWIIIAAIVFVLALIGYLSESKKKNKESLENDNASSNDTNSNVEAVSTVNNEAQPAVNSQPDALDFNVMPEVNSVTEPQVSDSVVNTLASVAEAPSVSPVETTLENSSIDTVSVAEMPVNATSSIESSPVAEVPVSASVDTISTPVEPAAEASVSVPTDTTSTPVTQAQSTIEPDSVFTSNIDQVVSTPLPAEPAPIAPTPIPAVNTEVKTENLSDSSSDGIETL